MVLGGFRSFHVLVTTLHTTQTRTHTQCKQGKKTRNIRVKNNGRLEELQTTQQQIKKGRQIIVRLFSSLSEISKRRLPGLATRYVFLVA